MAQIINEALGRDISADSVEDQAKAILDGYLEGKLTIEDLMGPLTADRSVNDDQLGPDINIPPGGKNPMPTAANVDAEPADVYNKKLVENVHPPDYVNAEPAEKYDLVVVGAGVAGLLSVIMGKALGKRCAMIERHYMGGDCLNVGCFPSKVLIASARHAHALRNGADDLGVSVDPDSIKVDFPKIMERIRKLRSNIAPVDSVARYKKDFCEEIFLGEAKFVDKETVVIAGGPHGDRTLKFDKAMIATGASPMVPPIPGLKDTPHLTNANMFNLTDMPKTMTVIGAGPIGMELSQAMVRLGCKVNVLEMHHQFLPREDPDAAKLVAASLEKDGVKMNLKVKFVKVEASEEGNVLCAPFKTYKITTEIDGKEVVFESEALLNGTGRVPNVFNIGLEEAGVEYCSRQGVHVDDFYMTANPNIYATGDCASPFKFTHSADFMARIAIRNMFLGDKTKGNRLVVPWCTYVSPEVAHVGMYEEELKKKNIPHESYVRTLEHVDRCIADGTGEGFVKISVAADSDTILGATIVAPHAGDMISAITMCIQFGIGASKLAGTIHPYPTTQEAVRQCAAQYNKNYKTDAIKLALKQIGAKFAAKSE